MGQQDESLTLAIVAILVDRLGGEVWITEEEVIRSKHTLTQERDAFRLSYRLAVDHVAQRGETLTGEIVDDPVAEIEQAPNRIVGEGEPLTGLCWRCQGSGELLTAERWRRIETCPTCAGSGIMP